MVIREHEDDYKLNKCDTKGHLPALKAKCNKILMLIEINKKVNKYLKKFIFLRTKSLFFQLLLFG